LVEAVSESDASLRQIAVHLINLGGKRLRPALLFLARGGGFVDDSALRAAAAVELIHLASLYHDDVMDRAALRRGAVSVNARWGNSIAALSGTFLFSRAELLLVPLGDELIRLASHAASQLCTGQLREAENAFNLDLSIEEHLQIVELKTATMFCLAARLGASLGRLAVPATEALATYAHHLGLAFQLYDDILDILGEPKNMGKQTGSDMRGGIYSLPFLHLLSQSGGQARQLRRLLQKQNIAYADLLEAFQLVLAGGHVDAALRRARTQARMACEALAPLQHGPVRGSLEALANYAVHRRL
jgi:heptaprenyl diphosphate synthase